MTDTQYLEDIISQSGLKREYLAKRCGITRQALANKITNKTPFIAREISLLCEALNITSLKEKDRIFFAKEVE